MYARDESREERTDVLLAAMARIRFATLVLADDAGLPQAVHLPVVVRSEGSPMIECHVARANPIWKLLDRPRPALVMAQGPQAYVRPGWYPAKHEHGKVVPTWSYVAVHARGPAEIMGLDDLLAHVRELSDQEERGQELPWSVDDAPPSFITALARGIVGIRVPIEGIEGVWKMNQHRSAADRAGMIAGLEARGDAASAEIAAAMREAAGRLAE